MKIKNIFITALAALSLTSCMDLEPVSSISDSKYWKDQAQFAAFNVGLQGLFREKVSYSMNGENCVQTSMPVHHSLVRLYITITYSIIRSMPQPQKLLISVVFIPLSTK